MRQTFKTFLMNNAAAEPLNIGNYLAFCDARGERPYFRVEFVAPAEAEAG